MMILKPFDYADDNHFIIIKIHPSGASEVSICCVAKDSKYNPYDFTLGRLAYESL